jgi:hypothetical protein
MTGLHKHIGEVRVISALETFNAVGFVRLVLWILP